MFSLSSLFAKLVSPGRAFLGWVSMREALRVCLVLNFANGLLWSSPWERLLRKASPFALVCSVLRVKHQAERSGAARGSFFNLIFSLASPFSSLGRYSFLVLFVFLYSLYFYGSL